MQTRNSMIATIHVAKKQLSIDDDTYRAMLVRVTKHDSLKICTVQDLQNIIKELKTKGFKVKAAFKKSTPTSTAEHYRDPRDKALSLWIQLYKIGAVRNGDDAALAKYCAKIVKIDHWHWLDGSECYIVIESLKAWLARETLVRFADTLYKTGVAKEELTKQYLLDLAIFKSRGSAKDRYQNAKSLNSVSGAMAQSAVDFLAKKYDIPNNPIDFIIDNKEC